MIRRSWNLRDIGALAKLPITAMSAFSAAVGALLVSGPGVATGAGAAPSLGAATGAGAPTVEGIVSGRLAATLLAASGTFLLACAAAALNEVQEKDLDAKMARTAARPLPSGRLSVSFALAFVFVAAVVGAALLAGTGHVAAPLLGMTAMVLYNGVYTPLKRVTPLSVLPGALVGAIPPAIGWTAAGGHPLHASILAFAAFMVLWQVPHFWLLLLRRGPEYVGAGLKVAWGARRDNTGSLLPAGGGGQAQEMRNPLPTDGGRQGGGAPALALPIFLWVSACAFAALLLPLFGLTGATGAAALALLALATTVLVGVLLLRPAGNGAAMFAAFNCFALGAMVVLAIEQFSGKGA